MSPTDDGSAADRGSTAEGGPTGGRGSSGGRDPTVEGRSDPGDGSAAIDGALAALALLGVAVAGALLDARFLPPAGVAGGVGTLALEALLGRRHDRVRAAWARPAARAGTVLGGAVAAGVGLWAAPSLAASALGGGLAAYLALLALVGTDLLAPPREWYR